MELIDNPRIETYCRSLRSKPAELDLDVCVIPLDDGRKMQLRPQAGDRLRYEIDVLILDQDERREAQLLGALRANMALSHERTTALRFSERCDHLVLSGILYLGDIDDPSVGYHLQEKLEETERLASVARAILDHGSGEVWNA